MELESPLMQNLRKLHIEGFPNHLIFYRWEANANAVLILGVVHGARDFESMRYD